MNIDSRWMLEPKCPHKEIHVKKSTLGLIVCLVITVIVCVVAVISEKKAKAAVRCWETERVERDANNLRERKRIEDQERINNPYSGDCMREPPEPVPVVTRTNTALEMP